MSSSWWSRLTLLALWFGALVQGTAAVKRGRLAVADTVRQTVPNLRHGFSVYCGLLVLLGMVTAGFVVLPMGLVLLAQGLLRDSVDHHLVGGLLLCLVGLLYLVGPVLVIQAVSHFLFGRLQRRVDGLADRVEGRH